MGCGYLGLRVAAKLLARGEQVFGTTRGPEKVDRFSALGIQPVLLDVTRRNEIHELPEVDRVLHCVGFDRSAGRSIREVYVDGFSQVLDLLNGPITRLVYVSSTGVYGESDGEWVDEETPPVPRTESGRACLEAENLAVGSRFDATILRLSGLYGPGRVVGKTAMEKGEPISGDPEGWLNLIEIDDAAEAAIAALDRGAAGRIYLATDNRPLHRREYYESMARWLKVDPPRFRIGEALDKSNKRVSNRRIKEELGLKLDCSDIQAGLTKVFRDEAAASEGR